MFSCFEEIYLNRKYIQVYEKPLVKAKEKLLCATQEAYRNRASVYLCVWGEDGGEGSGILYEWECDTGEKHRIVFLNICNGTEHLNKHLLELLSIMYYVLCIFSQLLENHLLIFKLFRWLFDVLHLSIWKLWMFLESISQSEKELRSVCVIQLLPGFTEQELILGLLTAKLATKYLVAESFTH